MKKMKEKEIKQVLDNVQQQLDALQGSGASFLFIGHEGNRFVLSGDLTKISAQIIVAMIRYPIVRDIFKQCAERYDEVNARYGQKVREIKMDHLIEQYPDNC